MYPYSRSFLYFIHLTTITSLVYADINYTDVDFSAPVNTMISSDTVTGNVTINTTSAVNPEVVVAGGFGLNAIDASHMTVNNATDFKINANFGIRAVNNTGSGISTVLLNGPGDIKINAGDRGIFIGRDSSLTSQSKIAITSGRAGIWAYESGNMTFNKEVDIIAQNFGVIVQKMDPSMSDPHIVFNDKVSINVQGSGAAVIGQAGSGAEGGKIEFNNGLVAEITDGNVLESTQKTNIIVKGDSQLTAKSTGSAAAIAEDGLISISGKSIIKGDIAGINGGIVNLNLIKDSIVTGAMTTNTGTGQVNLDMTGGTWNMTESSDITYCRGAG